MAGSFVNRLGDSPEEGIKAPVVAATEVPILLQGEQAIGTINVTAGDRVLVRAQIDPVDNGIYHVDNAAWTRTTDFNEANDVVNGVLVLDSSDGDLFRAEFTGPFQPGITPVAFTLVASLTGGGLDPNQFVPIIGTTVGNPLTGSLEMFDAPQNKRWRFGIIGGGFDDLYLTDLIGDGNQAFSILNNNMFTTFNGKGEVLVDTVYDVNTPDNALVTKQYVENAVGGPQGEFIPLAGTTPGFGVTGTIDFENNTLGVYWNLGISEGITDVLTLAATPLNVGPTGFLLVTGDGVTTHSFAFNEFGYLTLPDVDFSAGDPLSVVSKQYVDNVAGAGGAFIPLAGTDAGAGPVTGIIEHQRVTENTEFSVGLTNLVGFDDGFLIAATASSRADSKIYFVTGQATSTSEIDELGRFTMGGLTVNTGLSEIRGKMVVGPAVDADVYELLVDGDLGVTGDAVFQGIAMTGFISTGGGTIDGDVVIGSDVQDPMWQLLVVGDLGVTGDAVFQGIACTGVNSTGGGFFDGDVSVGVGNTVPPYRLYVAGDVGIVNDLVVQGIATTGIISSGQVEINAASPTAGSHAARKDYVDGAVAGKANLSGANFSGNISTPSTLTTVLTISGGGFPFVINAFAGGGTRFLKCDNNGAVFASIS